MLVLGSQVFKKGGWQPGFGSRKGGRAGSLPLSLSLFGVFFVVALSQKQVWGDAAALAPGGEGRGSAKD